MTGSVCPRPLIGLFSILSIICCSIIRVQSTCNTDGPTARELVSRICDCNTPSRNCYPLCPYAYIECGGKCKRHKHHSYVHHGQRRCKRGANTFDGVVRCEHGKVYDSVRKECVHKSKAKFTCQVTKAGTAAVKTCTTADCFCATRVSGQYVNPFDNFCQSAIVCNTNGKFPSNIEAVLLCGTGQRYNPTTKKCDAAARVPCGDAPVDSCSDPVCFCSNRQAGLYDNPFDFEGNSALECGTCSTFIGIYYGPPGAFFNGQDFVIPTAQVPKPQLCGQASGGIKSSSDRISRVLFNITSGGRRLSTLSTMDIISEDFEPVALWANSTCGRSVLAIAPRNAVQTAPARACNAALRCPVAGKNGYVRLGCYMTYCLNRCALLASTKNLCVPKPPAG